MKYLIDENNGCAFYSKKLPPLNFVMFDNEIFLNDQFVANTDNGESWDGIAPWNTEPGSGETGTKFEPIDSANGDVTNENYNNVNTNNGQ